MSWAEDLTVFFNINEFAVEATILGGPVIGIFDNESVIIEGYTGAVESTRPIFLCREANVSAVTHGTPVTINAVSYLVRGIRPDGTGLVRLILEAQ